MRNQTFIGVCRAGFVCVVAVLAGCASGPTVIYRLLQIIGPAFRNHAGRSSFPYQLLFRIVDVVDRERNMLVWEGAASGRVTDSTRRNLEETIHNAITDIFAEFP